MDSTSTLLVSNMVSSTEGLFTTIGAPIFEFALTVFIVVFIGGWYYKTIRRGINSATR